MRSVPNDNAATALVMAGVRSLNPTVVHAVEADAVTLQVVDRTSGKGARADWASDLPGVVRSLLRWTVRDPPGTKWEFRHELDIEA